MSEINSNRPAFPTHTQQGLTKREEFAKAALQDFCGCADLCNATARDLAGYAVEQADALLAELEKPVNDLEAVHVDD